jgi:hypothetical protein
MIDQTRHELLERLRQLSELAPEMRMGQLIANLSTMAEGPWDETLWNLEDAKLLAAASELATALDRRQAPIAQ